MAKMSKGLWAFIVLVVAGAILYGQGMLPFATTGQFTLASWELDDYGEVYFAGSPLSFATSSLAYCNNDLTSCLDGATWKDDQGKFEINLGIGRSYDLKWRPYVDATSGALIIPGTAYGPIAPASGTVDLSRDIKILNDVRTKDIKIVYEYGGQWSYGGRNAVTQNAGWTIMLDGAPAECRKEMSSPSNDIRVIEWRSSNIQEGMGAMFVDGIKVCEAQLTGPASFHMTGFNQQNPVKIWAVGQRLPYNCRIDTSHEAFFVERFAGGSAINLNTFAFEPVAFCKDSPVVRVASQPVEGITSSTEPFLRWAEAKTLTVPEHEVWMVSYVADWKRAGLSSGCAAYDRYLVNESKCESEARIVIAQKNNETGEVKVDVNTLTETGTVIKETVASTPGTYNLPIENYVMLDQAPAAPEVKKQNYTTMIVIVSLVVLLILAWWLIKKKK